MAKSKEVKNGVKAKSAVKPLSTVKNGAITKPSQTLNAKSKQIAKETASKISGKKSSKPVKKAATPSSSESESESESDSDDASSDESESEAEVKPVARTNGKTNGKAKKQADSDSSSSESSDSSDSDSDEEVAAAKPEADSDDSDDSESSGSSDSDSEAESDAAPVAAKKSVDAGVNGKAKAKKDESDSDDSSDSSEEEEDDSDDSDDSSSDSEAEAPSKKRKAEQEEVAPVKKTKVEGGEDTGSKNLFVGNLSWNVDDDWLLREFEEFGEITGARVISDKATGRSKGFGYVEFTNSADAAAALKAKQKALIDGREANVDFSTPRDNTAPRERAQGRAQQYGDSTNPPSDTLFLGNLSFDADENTVGEAFGEHGTVVNVRLPTDMETGNPKGFGYVTFASIDDAKAAYDAMTGAEIAGRPVRLDYATPKPDRGDGGRGGGRGGRGGGRGGRGGFDRGGRGGGRGGARGGRGGSTNRGGFGDFQGKKQTF